MVATSGGLAEYRRKRDFRRTREPRGRRGAAAAAAGRYVVQRHAARRLHYDFRLEYGGVLLSWAVPKGPGAVGERRLAVRTEDHPLGYAEFEGEIPAGEYGAGQVRIWDRGTWRPEGDVDRALARGRLDFRLDGGRLAGRWHLVRLGGRGARAHGDEWLLIRGADEEAGEPAAPKAGGARRGALAELAGQLSLARLVDRPPAGRDWLHETKWDGYRLMGVRDGDAVTLVSRSGADWTERLPEVAEALRAVDAQRFVIDGELVHLQRGRSSFKDLQAALSEPPGSGPREGLRLVAFDLLVEGDEDLRPLPLLERKRRLATLLRDVRTRRLRLSPHRRGGGEAIHAEACAGGLEGLVSKRATSPYRAGRGGDWLKSKCRPRQELVIVGWTPARGDRRSNGLGALLLATGDGSGGLRYVGRVGSGFDSASRQLLACVLPAVATTRAPLEVPRAAARGVRWVRPRLVAEVAFADWTGDGRLRQASFLGLRQDKAARDVVRERATGGDSSDVVAGVRISHPERALFVDSERTKLDLARYFDRIWPWIEPHLEDRPLAFLRCPEGARSDCFFQKHWEAALPGTDPVTIEERDGPEPYLRVGSRQGLVALAQHGVIELHLWGARAAELERPDRWVFDLDPGPEVPWSAVVRGARRLRDLLQRLGLRSFAMTSGGTGVHVVAPLEPVASWDEVRAASAAVARALAEHDPATFVARATKAERRGRIFVDYLRNGRGATAIAPYCPRARAGAPVAMPIRWEELARSAPARWTIDNVFRRLGRLRADAWKGYFELRQRLPAGLVSAGRARRSTGRLDMAEKDPSGGGGRRRKTRRKGATRKSTRKATRKSTRKATRKSAREPSRKSTRKSAAGKRTRKSGKRKATGRKYGKKAAKKVREAVREMKRGTLRSGRSGKKVRSRKQAIAIGLAEARREGGKVPEPPADRENGD